MVERQEWSRIAQQIRGILSVEIIILKTLTI